MHQHQPNVDHGAPLIVAAHIRPVGEAFQRVAVDDGNVTALARNHAEAFQPLQCHGDTGATDAEHHSQEVVR
jgi:hypothetical protein